MRKAWENRTSLFLLVIAIVAVAFVLANQSIQGDYIAGQLGGSSDGECRCENIDTSGLCADYGGILQITNTWNNCPGADVEYCTNPEQVTCGVQATCRDVYTYQPSFWEARALGIGWHLGPDEAYPILRQHYTDHVSQACSWRTNEEILLGQIGEI
ncbi:MAG: hypothetical protein KKA90_02125 [Nanoarchaeota archaeon]|nr:hypothetical protein [Nanoarchaeota archaeon]